MVTRFSRANSRELKIIKTFLLKKYGNKCYICDNDFPPNQLVIDHVDNDHTNWAEVNLRLACQKHNIRKNPPYSKKKYIDNSCVSVCVEQEPQPKSLELAINIKAEPKFREWIKNEMKKYLRMDLEDVIDSGAEYAEVSVDTVRSRYLKKLTSRLGPFNVIEEQGIKVLEWKKNHFPLKDKIKKYVKQV